MAADAGANSIRVIPSTKNRPPAQKASRLSSDDDDRKQNVAVDEYVVQADDPASADVEGLLARHLAFAADHSPPEDRHALDMDGLLNEDVSFFSIRSKGELVAIGALKQLAECHLEIKSMHTAEGARRRGVARAMLGHLLGVARSRGCRRVSLETGSTEAFAPARALYESAGFRVCEPFADYDPSANSVFMTLALASPRVTE